MFPARAASVPAAGTLRKLQKGHVAPLPCVTAGNIRPSLDSKLVVEAPNLPANPRPAVKTFSILLLPLTMLPAAAEGTSHLAGTVRNIAGLPIGGLTLHFYHRKVAGFDHLTTITAADGKWSMELPPGVWRGAAHTDDLLARGYFCEPGFVWCGGAGDQCGGEVVQVWPPLWGPGFIEWNRINVPANIILTVIPTRPGLAVEKPRTEEAGVKISFETTTAAMTTIRQWRVEKSTDLVTWKPMQTVALSGVSPVIVPDPASVTAPVCYYRAVQVDDIIVPQ